MIGAVVIGEVILDVHVAKAKVVRHPVGSTTEHAYSYVLRVIRPKYGLTETSGDLAREPKSTHVSEKDQEAQSQKTPDSSAMRIRG